MSTKRERILRKLNPTLLKMTPRLSGDAGSFIDLDSEDSLEEGAKKLMMRFLKNQDIYVKNRLNSREKETEVTISSAKYNENEEICELITERLSLPFVRNDKNDSERPGKRLQKLKMELQEKISAKWEEEYKKRVGEIESLEKKHKEKKKRSQKDSSSDSETDDEEDIAEKCDEVELSEDRDDEAHVDEDRHHEKVSDAGIVCQDEQNENSSNHESSKDKTFEKDIEYEDSEACSLVPAYQPGGGLLYGGSELTQGDEELPQNLLSPTLRLSMNESPGSKLSESFSERTPKKPECVQSEDDDSLLVGKKKLFSQNPNNSFDLNDAFEFCSGKFPDADNAEMQTLKEGNADDYENENEEEEEEEEEEDEGDEEANEGDDEEENEDDDEEVHNSAEEADNGSELPRDNRKIRKNIIAFEDSEEEEEVDKQTEDKHITEEEETHPKALELLSEDEDEPATGNDDAKGSKKSRKNLRFSDEEDAGNDCEGEAEERDEGEESERADEDDGEDDERSIHYDSEENEIVNPREFFEKEAELSGSEWSGDEDERGLDEFDVEEGDADNIDTNQVRSQLEKIHIRRVLDDDAKEVRLIQEILFEDGDLHSDGKRRDRKFKWKNLGAFEEQLNDEEAKGDGGHSSDDCAEEENLRKIRYEKELFLMAKKSEDASSDEEITSDIQMVKVTRIKSSERGRGNGDKSKVVTNCVEMAKNSLLSRTRGSFLARNEEFLSRLAKVTSSLTENVLGPKHSRNFVFASKSPEKRNPERNAVCKRQAEDGENCGRSEKRMKVLPAEVDTGPSILDLLV